MELKIGLKITFIIDFILGLLIGLVLLIFPAKITELFSLGFVDFILLRLIGAFLIGLGSASLIASLQNSWKIAKSVMYMHLIWLIPATGVILDWIIRDSSWVSWFILVIFVIYIGLFAYFLINHAINKQKERITHK